jgi:mannose-6-phosphate isomerase-like protein (cupin superfamily)
VALGAQELVYDGKTLFLEKGDCCYFESRRHHFIRSIGGKKSKVLVVYAVKF